MADEFVIKNGAIIKTGGTLTIGDPAGTGYRLPTTDGDADQALVTDGDGNVSFTTVRSIPAGTIGDIQYNDGAEGFAGDPNFNTDGSGNVSIVGSLEVDELTFNDTTILGVGDANDDILLETSGSGLILAKSGYDMSAGPNRALATKGYVDDVSQTGLDVQPRKLLIYYAIPININGVNDADYAAGILANYDDVVLGGGLQDPEHANYATTTSIIQKLAALSPNTVVWGYIDIGVSTNNHSLATLQEQIDQWVFAGATGIFCDDYGYDYQVSRTRQNDVLTYIHSKGIGAIMNAWNIDHVFSPAVEATYNPSGTATVADERDVYLLESWVFNTEVVEANPAASYHSSRNYYAIISDIKTRGDAARTYRTTFGSRMFAVNIAKFTGTSPAQLEEYRGVAEALANIWRLDGSGVAVASYASSGDDVALVTPYDPLIGPVPKGRPLAPYILNGGWDEIQSPDIGITVHFEDTEHTWFVNDARLSRNSEGDIDVNARKITNLAEPTFDTDAATKAYVDALPGYKNWLHNGDFRISQRRTASSYLTTNGGWIVDRWKLWLDGSGSWVASYSPGGSLIKGKNWLMFYRHTSSTYLQAEQSIYDDFLIHSAGVPVTLSFDCYTPGGYTTTAPGNLSFGQVFGTGGSATVWTDVASWSVSPGRHSFTFTLPSILSKTLGTKSEQRVIFVLNTPTLSAAGSVWVANIQIELGSSATAYERRTDAVELAICERFYQKSYAVETNPATATSVGAQSSFAFSTSYLQNTFSPFRVRMRKVPTVTLYSTVSPSAGTIRESNGGVNYSITANGTVNVSETSFQFSSHNATLNANGYYHWHWTADAE